MFCRNPLIAALVLASMAFACNDAEANFTLNFNSSSTSSNNPHTGASATVELSFSDFSGDVRITLVITNTTGSPTFGAGATTSKLTGVALDLASGSTPVSGSFAQVSSPGYLDTFLTNVNFTPFSNNVGLFNSAVADNTNFEGGNAQDALPEGVTTTVRFDVDASQTAAAYEAALLAGYQDGVSASLFL